MKITITFIQTCCNLLLQRNDGDTGTGVNAVNTNPIRSSAIVNIGRDERGWMNAFWKPRFLLFFYFLPYIFSWGPRQFFKTLFKCYSSFFNCELYAEMTEHLGVKMSDCLQLEYLATQLGHFGKGYGKTLIEVGKRKFLDFYRPVKAFFLNRFAKLSLLSLHPFF